MKIHLLIHHIQIEHSFQRSVFMQLFEPKTKQMFRTHVGVTDGSVWEKQTITFNFAQYQVCDSIELTMYDSNTNEVIAYLPLPLNIIPFDLRVNSKFLMVNMMNDQNQFKFDMSNFLLSSNQNNSTPAAPAANVGTMSTVSTMSAMDDRAVDHMKKKIKLFLIIHLSTFGQLPFHAKKGALLKHLKEVTRKSSPPSTKKKNTNNEEIKNDVLEFSDDNEHGFVDVNDTNMKPIIFPKQKNHFLRQSQPVDTRMMVKAGSCGNIKNQNLMSDILVE